MGKFNMPFRVGIGYDAHRFEAGRDLILGGVKIPHEKGLLGHSDADALCHAVTDAVLGAASLGDIGRHFPDTDPKWKGADSIVLLRECVALAAKAGWSVVNVDAVVVCQKPKLALHVDAMIGNLSQALKVSKDAVGIKGKTTENMGFEGREEGISVQAVVLLQKP
jgi:2-C-methyl-D-erythritol 2,4-cyclodiphosphate synthase